jgi:hypothetical protein
MLAEYFKNDQNIYYVTVYEKPGNIFVCLFRNQLKRWSVYEMDLIDCFQDEDSATYHKPVRQIYALCLFNNMLNT